MATVNDSTFKQPDVISTPQEPILTRDLTRFSLFPIKDSIAYEMYKKAEASFWTVEEVDLAVDYRHFEALTSDEKHFILRVLGFFATADGIVNENLVQNFMNEVTIPEMRLFYGFQIAIEGIHNEMYGLLIQVFEKNAEKQKKLFNALEEVPSIQTKANWALKWLNSDRPFAERLIAFACVEGIFFSASFCAIFYLKKRQLMPGLTFSNELISRDEGLHRDFACYVYSRLHHKLEEKVVHEIVSSAVDAEREFVADALHVNLIGMNGDLMMEYVKHVANHLLLTLGCSKLYNATNPFEWMDLISLQGKTNFFEKRVGEYQKSGIMETSRNHGNVENITGARAFTTAADF